MQTQQNLMAILLLDMSSLLSGGVSSLPMFSRIDVMNSSATSVAVGLDCMGLWMLLPHPSRPCYLLSWWFPYISHSSKRVFLHVRSNPQPSALYEALTAAVLECVLPLFHGRIATYHSSMIGKLIRQWKRGNMHSRTAAVKASYNAEGYGFDRTCRKTRFERLYWKNMEQYQLQKRWNCKLLLFASCCCNFTFSEVVTVPYFSSKKSSIWATVGFACL